MKSIDRKYLVNFALIILITVNIAQAKTSKNDSIQNYSYAPDSVIVKYKSMSSQQGSYSFRKNIKTQLLDNLSSIDNQDSIKFETIFNHDQTIDKVYFKGTNVKEVLKLLNKNPNVIYAEPNYILHNFSEPNDPSFNELWGLNNTGQTGGKVGADISAVKAWNLATGSEQVVVGIIDTGIDYDYEHEDLKQNIWINSKEIASNNIDDDSNGYIDDIHGINTMNSSGDPRDDNGHGTHVSGTIGARGDNNTGITGVVQKVKLIGCKFLGEDGSGSTSGAIACLNYFVKLKLAGVNIVATNNSYGGGGYSQAMFDAINLSIANGIIFVAAAGNSGTSLELKKSYPNSYDIDGILSVANSDKNDELVSHSNYNLFGTDIAAPGTEILSTTPNNNYGLKTGTSMSSPHIVGAIALLKSYAPNITINEMKNLLMQTVDKVDSLLETTVSGGRLNVEKALDDLDPKTKFRLTISPLRRIIKQGESIEIPLNVFGNGDWNDTVTLAVKSDISDIKFSKKVVKPGDKTTLKIITTSTTKWGLHKISVKGSSSNISKSVFAYVYVRPKNITRRQYDKEKATVNEPQDYNSVLNIDNNELAFNVTVNIDTERTGTESLQLIFVSPDGRKYPIERTNTTNEDSLKSSHLLSSFDGKKIAGDWTLKVKPSDSFSISWSVLYDSLRQSKYSPPKANFSIQHNYKNITFINTSSDPDKRIKSYLWKFGDNSSSTQRAPVHQYDKKGDYNVSLTVIDTNDVEDTITKKISVKEKANEQEKPEITGQKTLIVLEDNTLQLKVNDFTYKNQNIAERLYIQSGSNYTFSGTVITPKSNYNGLIKVTVIAEKGKLKSPPFITNITVSPVNDTPEAKDDKASVTFESKDNSVDVLANDTDVDSTVLKIKTVSYSGKGSVKIVDNKILYSPSKEYSGDEIITYSIEDDKAAKSSAKLTITVKNKSAQSKKSSTQQKESTSSSSGSTSYYILIILFMMSLTRQKIKIN